MSIASIKAECEKHLNSNWSDTPIAWSNVPFNQTPNSYLEVFTIPITDERELISHSESFKVTAFFQINIRVKVDLGTGIHFSYLKTLTDLFREKNLNDVYCTRVTSGAIFQDDEYMVLPFRVVGETWSA